LTFLTITCFINFSYVLQCSFLLRVYMLTRYSIRLYSDLSAHGLIVYRCQTRFPYQTYVLFTIAMIGATRGTGTAYRPKHIRLPPLFCGVCITYVYPRCLVEFVLHTFTPVV
jgi:hypothetical protein